MKELTSEALQESMKVAAGFGTPEGNILAVALEDFGNTISLTRAGRYATKLGSIRTTNAKNPVLVLLIGSAEDLAVTERDFSRIDRHHQHLAR